MGRLYLRRSLLVFMCLIFSLNGCGGGGGSISVLPSTDEFEQHTNADVKIDILFVVDDSGSMAQEQQDIYDNFREFIALFYDKGFDFRVAVAKTSAYGNTISCKPVGGGSNTTCASSTTGTRPFYIKDGNGNYLAGTHMATEGGLTPKEFRCGHGNSCGLNSNYQTAPSIAGTDDPDGPPSDTTPLKTTVGNGTPAENTDHILASSNLTKNQMIDKFKRNILVGLAGSGDERALESAETVIRNMKQFYSPATQFPRANAHLAIIHVGDEGDGPIPNTAGTTLHGSNRSGSSPYTTSSWGSLRSTFINNSASYFNNIPGIPAYDPITLVANNNLVIADHLNSVESYFDALKKHQPTSTVSVHAIQDLPNAASVSQFPYIPATAVDTTGNTGVNQAGNAIGYFQAYMANLSTGGLIFSKQSNFGTSLALLGDTISSLASFFQLEGHKLDATAQSNLQVYVGGINGNNPIPNNSTNGYQYDETLNRITFYGSMIPPQGATIGLIYTCATLTCPAFP